MSLFLNPVYVLISLFICYVLKFWLYVIRVLCDYVVTEQCAKCNNGKGKGYSLGSVSSWPHHFSSFWKQKEVHMSMMKSNKFGVRLVFLWIMFCKYKVEVFCTHVFDIIVFDLRMYEMLVLKLSVEPSVALAYE